MASIVSNDDFVNAVAWLFDNGQLIATGERFIDASARKVWDEQALATVDITPSQLVLEAALDSANAAILANDALNNEHNTIAQKAELALQFLPDIRKLMNADIDLDIASANLAQRFAAFGLLFTNDISAPFRNRFYASLLALQNIDVVALGIANLTAAQQRIFCTYLKIFVNQYALLALFAIQQ